MAWQKLGLPPPSKLDDRLGPAVDKEFLRRFVRDELPEEAAEVACRLILLFPGWSQAHEEVAEEEFRGRGGA